MMSSNQQTEARILGDKAPLRFNMSRGLLDRRRISKRWLSGLILAGVTSLYLMGGALYAALDGREKLTMPAQFYENKLGSGGDRSVVAKGDRPKLEFASAASSDSNIMMVSTIARDGDQNVIKRRPFLYAKVPLAIAPRDIPSYPPFNPLSLYSAGSNPKPQISDDTDSIYGEAVESEVTIKMVDFDTSDSDVYSISRRNLNEIERVVRQQAPGMDDGATNVASLAFIDPARFGEEEPEIYISNPDVTIRTENVSVVNKGYEAEPGKSWYEEEIKTIVTPATYKSYLEKQGLDPVEAGFVANVLKTDLSESKTHVGDKYRLAYQVTRKDDETREKKIYRVSVYRSGRHMVSIARSDDNRLVYSKSPTPLPQLSKDKGAKQPALVASNLPSAYDGIYRAALSQELGEDVARKLVQIMAFDVDFRATITPLDELSVFMSLEDGEEKPTEKSEILFASIKLNNKVKRYYRFRDPDSGKLDYYDETGKSSRKFLLRKPVPNARFKSPYGMRRHPISGIRKLHTGVDWAAPRGTPILAAGDGVVEKAGWAGGYGRRTVIRHAYGYETTYNHQSRISRSVKPGARVRQGQIIGKIGTTGYSTGPHLHYEVKVNDRFVNPMRIRLPSGGNLEDQNLASFAAERKRIDDLLKSREGGDQLAAAK